MIAWGVRAAISRDVVARKLWWLLRRPNLQDAHAKALADLRDRLRWTEEERGLINALFALYHVRHG